MNAMQCNAMHPLQRNAKKLVRSLPLCLTSYTNLVATTPLRSAPQHCTHLLCNHSTTATLPHKTHWPGDIHFISKTMKPAQQCGLLASMKKEKCSSATAEQSTLSQPPRCNLPPNNTQHENATQCNPIKNPNHSKDSFRSHLMLR